MQHGNETVLQSLPSGQTVSPSRALECPVQNQMGQWGLEMCFETALLANAILHLVLCTTRIQGYLYKRSACF